jgi:hypothetical protein
LLKKLLRTPSLDIRVCDTFYKRAVGILPDQPLGVRASVWLDRCSMVHTFGMRQPLSLLFLSEDLKPLKWQSPAKPWRVYRQSGAHAVIEMAYRAPAEREVIEKEIMARLDRLKLAENILIRRIEARIQNATKHNIYR